MSTTRKAHFSAVLLVMSAFTALTLAFAPVGASAAEIKYIVNKVPVTSYDIQKRVAFLKLLQRRGNLQSIAADEMIEQILRAQEMKRLKINISNRAVADAYERFAQSNKMSIRQMDGILAQTGVTKDHFHEYIRSQMGWGQAVNSRASAGGQNSKDAIREMMKNGEKPAATEYVLQQVILVVPERERRSLLGKRKREAQSLRQQFSGCENSKQIAKTMLDVTVRELGRILEPELPPEWEKPVKAVGGIGPTTPRETERGVEFLVVCSTRVATDDRVAELLYQQEQAKENGGNEQEALSKTYTAELREKAQIVTR